MNSLDIPGLKTFSSAFFSSGMRKSFTHSSSATRIRYIIVNKLLQSIVSLSSLAVSFDELISHLTRDAYCTYDSQLTSNSTSVARAGSG